MSNAYADRQGRFVIFNGRLPVRVNDVSTFGLQVSWESPRRTPCLGELSKSRGYCDDEEFTTTGLYALPIYASPRFSRSIDADIMTSRTTTQQVPPTYTSNSATLSPLAATSSLTRPCKNICNRVGSRGNHAARQRVSTVRSKKRPSFVSAFHLQ